MDEAERILLVRLHAAAEAGLVPATSIVDAIAFFLEPPSSRRGFVMYLEGLIDGAEHELRRRRDIKAKVVW